jgi:transcriptional regulator with XRE-family HTH domain
METLGMLLKGLRDNLGLMQKSVAKEIGIHSKVLSHYENDVRLPDLHTFMLLCKFYNVSSDQLLGLNNTFMLSNASISEDEKTILEYFRELNKRNKDIAKGYLANLSKDQGIVEKDIVNKKNVI